MTLGECLREARLYQDLTQTEVSKKTGINNKTLSNWENDVSKPSPDDLAVLSTIYDVPTDKMIGGLLGDINNPKHPWYKRFRQQNSAEVAWHPSPEFFTNPETGRRVEAMNPQQQRIILASKDLSPEELDRIADLVETMAKAHRKD